MKLLIAIPALNEEQSIEAIIRRSLDAREHIIANSPVTAVDITVVSDGSTDRTLELARQFEPQINVIEFVKNRGYGAAIQEAWRKSDAELLSFLDADGTCEPKFFAKLCTKIEQEGSDVVLGCRMNAQSQMPPIRRVGNTIFAVLLGLFSSKRVRDTASGMRVIRRSSLKDLEPLPTGLHFTPAMSARAMLDRSLKIHEIDMPYAEREGRSKLHVVKDGMRFLRVIVEAAFLYRPERPLGIMGLLCLAAAFLLILTPAMYYVQNRSIAEWMIYRFIVSHLAAITAFLLFSASYITARVIAMTLGSAQMSPAAAFTNKVLHSSFFWVLCGGLFLAGTALVVPSFIQLVETGATYEHWSRFIAMSLCFAIAIILLATRACDYILGLLENRLEYLNQRDRGLEPVTVQRQTVVAR